MEARAVPGTPGGPGVPGGAAPGVKVGREGVLRHQDALARPDRQVDRRGPDAVAGGGHDGHVAGLGPDQAGEQGPQLLRLARRDPGVARVSGRPNETPPPTGLKTPRLINWCCEWRCPLYPLKQT